jgi:hypothetical protein
VIESAQIYKIGEGMLIKSIDAKGKKGFEGLWREEMISYGIFWKEGLISL